MQTHEFGGNKYTYEVVNGSITLTISSGGMSTTMTEEELEELREESKELPPELQPYVLTVFDSLKEMEDGNE